MMAVYFLSRHPDPVFMWKSTGVLIAIFTVYFLAEHLDPRRNNTLAAGLSGTTSLLMLSILPAATALPTPWPFLPAWILLGAGLLLRLRNGIKYRNFAVQRFFSAFARGDAGNDIAPIFVTLGRMETAFLTGYSLHQYFRFFIQKNRHK